MPDAKDAAVGGAAPVFAVLNCAVEYGYPWDPLSPPRESVSCTIHSSRDAAEARLLAELDYNTTPEGAETLRRSWLVAVAVPPEARGRAAPRWISDRACLLMSRAGASPGAYAGAAAAGYLGRVLVPDLAAAAGSLCAAIHAGDSGSVTRAALETAGAAARALGAGAVSEECAARLSSLAFQAGRRAWSGEDVSVLAPEADRVLDGISRLPGRISSEGAPLPETSR